MLFGRGEGASCSSSPLLTDTGRYSTALRGAPRQFASAVRASSHGQHRIPKEAHPPLRARALENREYTSAIKTYFRRLEALAKESDADATEAEHRRLVRTIDKAVKRGALHRNTGARKKSRAARVAAGKSS